MTPENTSPIGQSATPTVEPMQWREATGNEQIVQESQSVVAKIEEITRIKLDDPESFLFFCVVVPLLLICLIVSGPGVESQDRDRE